MRLHIVCVVIVYYIVDAHAWGKGDLEKYGPFQKALYSKYIKCNHEQETDLDVNLVDVYFYDFRDDVEKFYKFPIAEATEGILNIPGMELDMFMRRFIIFVPGYKSNINTNTEQRVRDAFKDLPNSYLIILDHSPYTNANQGYLKGYERSVQYVSYIGEALGEMLAGLKKGGISEKNMHCIGHSLGGQMLGYTGQIFYKITRRKLWRITALDPAGPCFSNSMIENQVRSGVAEYVEVYHCNAGGLGSSSVLADIDFFLNRKGEFQPNCGTPLIPGIFDSSKAAKCSHKTCVKAWTATVEHPEWFLAWKCDSYKMFKEGKCSANDVTLAGFWNPGNATGVYYFSTEGYDLDI